MIRIPRIDEYPELIEQLGKARADRIRYFQQGTGRRQPAGRNIENPIMQQMQELEYSGRNHEIDDIVTGAVNSVKTDSKPPSRHRLIVLFQCLPIINTRQIELLMNVGTRQAQYYHTAAKFALPHLQKHFDNRSQ